VPVSLPPLPKTELKDFGQAAKRRASTSCSCYALLVLTASGFH
jgi:hypothetical protein